MTTPEAAFRFTADSSAAIANIRNLRGAIDQLDTSSVAVSALGNSFKLLGATLISALSVASLASFAKATFSAADAVVDMASRVDASVSELSRLKYIAEQSDVEFQSLAVGIKQFQKNLVEGNPALQALGLSAAQLKSLSLSDQFASLAEAFKSVENPADRTRIAMELFGRSGVDLVPLMALGSDGMRRLGDEAQRVGAVMTDAAAAGISRADEAIKRMEASVRAAATSLLGKLAPAIAAVSDSISGALAAAGADPLQKRLDNLNDGIRKTSELIDELTLRRSRAGTIRLSDESVAGEKVGASRAGAGFDIEQLRSTMASLTAARDETLAKINAGTAATIADVQAVTVITAAETEKQRRLEQQLADDRLSMIQMVNAALFESRVNGSALYQQIASQEVDVNRASLNQQLADIQSFSSQRMELVRAELNDVRSAEIQKQQYRSEATSMAIQGLAQFGQKNKGFAMAAIVLNRAMAIADIGMSIAKANAKAVSLGPWGWSLIAANVALGIAEIANVNKAASGGGLGSSSVGLGSPVNPVFTNNTNANGDDSATQGAVTKGAVQVIFNGPVWGTDETRQMILDTVSEAVNDRDVVIIDGNSRQAQEFMPA